VLEYIEGRPLRGPLPLQDALRVAIQIAGALEAVHLKSILHRDLKPGNILVTGSGAKLVDFGLAKITAEVADDKMDGSLNFGGQTVPFKATKKPETEFVGPRSPLRAIGRSLPRSF